MNIGKISSIILLCGGMALGACKGKNSSKSDTTGKHVNLDTNATGVLSDSTMGKVPKAGNDSAKTKSQLDTVKQ